MKKLLVALTAVFCVFALAGCNQVKEVEKMLKKI